MANENEITIELVEQPDYIINLEKQGPAGLRGLQGEKGSQGDRGPQGEKGDTGEQGPSGTITIGEVETGLPGTDVIVTNTGTEENAIFNFTIPRGDVGPEGGTTFGIKGDYATHYGIEYCQYGLIENPVGTKNITVKGGMMLCVPGVDTKTTIGSDINYTIEASEDVTIFYADGSILEVLEDEVYYSTEEPIVTATGYTAWWNPQVGTWKFISADTGNVWREANATPLADIKIADDNITRIDYIGYRVLNDDIYAIKSEVDIELANKANIDLSNLTEDGEKHFLNKSQITNCIIEKPKYLDWTYTDGVLTLKAGSKLMYPDGFNSDGSRKFSYYTTTKDYTFGEQTPSASSLRYLWVARQGKYLNNYGQNMLYVGDTAPTTFPTSYILWYDTANNILRHTSNKGVNWSTNEGVFPFMTVKTVANQAGVEYPTSVFDGIGIMDKCAWIADRVKILIPNGRNSDGTLNNLEVTSEAKIMRLPWTIDTSNAPLVMYYPNIISSAGLSYTVSEEQPSTNYTLWYNPLTNETAYKGSSTSEWVYNNKAGVIGYYTSVYGDIYDSHSSILSVNFKEPFRAVDYNDFTNTPHIIETYVNGTSWYRVWSDGWIEQGGRISIRNSGNSWQTVNLLKSFANTNYTVTLSIMGTQENLEAQGLKDMTTSSFKVYAWNERGNGWYACGY